MVPIEKQIDFYRWQLSEIAEKWEAYFTSNVSMLIHRKEVYVGYLHGFDEARGNVIVAFPRMMGARLDQLYKLYYFEDESFKNGIFKSFSQKAENTDDENVMSLYILDRTESTVLIAIGNVPFNDFHELQKRKISGKGVQILLGKPEPPIKYLLRLAHFTEINKHTEVLNFDPDDSYKLKRFHGDKIDQLLAQLETDDRIIVQGPPGTGKSTLMAELIERFMDETSKVCVTANANKALIALAEKLRGKSVSNKTYKTNLTANERKSMPFLKGQNELMIPPSSLLLTTYYKLSSGIIDLKERNPYFDLLVIEEASQAFYTTLTSFSMLAKKVIIIGDPKQLPPIVLNKRQATKNIHRNVGQLINGLETLMKMNVCDNYILQETYRLNPYNTKLTNSFYEGDLISENKDILEVKVEEEYRDLFDSKISTKLWLQPDLLDDLEIKQFSHRLRHLLNSLTTENNNLHIAVLSPYRKDVLLLQELLAESNSNKTNMITIETIDRVQGLTVDICIVILKMDGAASFSYQLNRFNVATSRAKFYNILVVDEKYKFGMRSASKEVSSYFSQLESFIS